jgi:hypothetical protein
MSFTKSAINPSVIFLSLINFTLNKLRYHKSQTYDYTECVGGYDYVFEPIDNLAKGYMTAQCRGIKRGDYIILRNGSTFQHYQVSEIEYYSEPSDMWIAVLTQVQY